LLAWFSTTKLSLGTPTTQPAAGRFLIGSVGEEQLAAEAFGLPRFLGCTSTATTTCLVIKQRNLN